MNEIPLYISYFLLFVSIVASLFTKNPFFAIVYLGMTTTIFIGFIALLGGYLKTNLIFDSIIIYSLVGFMATIAINKYYDALKK